MIVVVNGEEHHFETAPTLYDVIDSLKLGEKVMAAAVNMNVVKKEQWTSYTLSDADKVELLDFVGGG